MLLEYVCQLLGLFFPLCLELLYVDSLLLHLADFKGTNVSLSTFGGCGDSLTVCGYHVFLL